VSDRATTYAILREVVLAEVERQRPGLSVFVAEDFGPSVDGGAHLLLTTGLDDGRYSYMSFRVAIGASAEVIGAEAASGVSEWLEHIDNEAQEAVA
jgi:hypothetical protein